MASTNMMNSSIHCKISFNGQLRRFTLESTEFTSLKETIAKLFSINGEFVLKYRDDESDYVILENQEDLKTALTFSPTILRIFVESKNSVSQISNNDSDGYSKYHKRHHHYEKHHGHRHHGCKKEWKSKEHHHHPGCNDEGSSEHPHGPHHVPHHVPQHGPNHVPDHVPQHGHHHGPYHVPDHGPHHGPHHGPYHGCKKDWKSKEHHHHGCSDESSSEHHHGRRHGCKKDWKLRVEKKLVFINQCLADFGDDSSLTPRELLKKQRLLRKKQRIESWQKGESFYQRKKQGLTTPEEEQLNQSLKNQILAVKIEAMKVKARHREIKMMLQDKGEDKALLDELSSLKEQKKQFKNQKKALIDQLHV